MRRILSLLVSIAMVLGVTFVLASAAEAGAETDFCTYCEQEQIIAHSEKIDPLCEDEGRTEGTYCTVCSNTISGRNPIEPLGHEIQQYDAKQATFTGVGWEAYEACDFCGYTTYVEIPKLPVPELDNYEVFVYYLAALEELAAGYVAENPGKDPVDLVIKYIRTGVERYNSGSWGIMAGYEDSGFAEFVAMMEDMVNSEASDPSEMVAICSLKNLGIFTMPNGDVADLGHMFGTMDITYHNNFSVNHADVAGWAGDLVDLLEFADVSGVDGTLDEMIAEISENYLGVTPPEGQAGFNHTDIKGDLDGFYITHALQEMDYEPGMLAGLLMEYFTEDLSEEIRADFFLRNRLDGVSVRSEVREAVYKAVVTNKVVATLEATREFQSDNLEELKKACCYAFADYLCRLAGDYVEEPDVSYFTVFSSEKSQLAPGVKQEIKYATTKDGKQTVFYLATADITRDDVHVFANYKDNDPTEWGMQRVLDQANAAQNKHGDPAKEGYIPNYNVIASVNGAGFNMMTGQPGGLLVMGGVEYSPINDSGFFGILKDGTAVIGTTEEYNTIYKDQVQEGIAGFGAVLIKDGKIVIPDTADYYNDRASRTAVGVTGTGKVVLMVMDGRQEPHSCGGSMQEIAQVLLEAGCVNAVNLDGGGSTTYVAKPEGEEELQVISKPSDGISRSVSTSLMIVSTAPDSKAFDHALVESPVDYMTVGASVQMSAAGVSATGNSAQIPEGACWAVDGDAAQIDQEGLLTALKTGSVDVNLMLDGAVIGTKTMEVVYPENLYFTKKNVDAVYGEQVVLPVKVLYNNKEVAVTAADVTFTLSNAAAGTINGFTFTGTPGTGIKNVQITAAVKLFDESEKTASLMVSLFNQGENTFDFEQATGGDRQLAWDRQVTNTTTDDEITYTMVDSGKAMVTSYTLALDMTQIPIPKQLEDLTYMLPGSDLEGASAWTFLCQLAERVSVLTEVTPSVTFDPNLEVDYSGLTINNDYFELKSVDFDEETNTLSLTLRWIDQTQPIDPATADPLCMVNGIKLTPKADAQWDARNRLEIVNRGEISYSVCLRASSLYTFANKPENQEVFGLYPYVNPDLPSDAGGRFSSTYAVFEDSYTLVNALKSGWVGEEGGFAYYVDGVKLTGVQAVGGVYYDFGTDGINADQTPYTGIFKIGEVSCYARNGLLLTSGWYRVGDKDYHCHADGSAHEAKFESTLSCIRGGRTQYTCSQCNTTEYVGDYIFPTGHDWDANYECRICGTKGKDVTTASKGFGTASNPKSSRYYYAVGGVRPSFYVMLDGKTLSYSNDNNLNSDGTMKDLYVSWSNDRGIGKAVMNIVGRGDYYGETKLEYTIVPNDVKNLRTANVSQKSITLTWDAAAGADYYRLYRYNNGSRTYIATVYGTSYTVTGLTPDTEYSFSAATSATSTDGESTTYNCPQWSNTLTVRTAQMPDSTGVVEAASITAGDSEVKMLRVDGEAYFFLPADADLSDLKLSLTLDAEVAGQSAAVSGSRGTVSGTASGQNCQLTLDLTQLADVDADGGYTIGVAAGEYRAMTIRVRKSASIPSMFITSDDPAQGRDWVDASKSNETTAQMTLIAADGTEIYSGALTQVKARGNSTFAHFPKKSYQIKLADKTDLVGQDEKVKTWVLLANYGDATLMHDKFFKDLAAQMEMPYVAGCQLISLWYDGEYRGVYLLSEKNSVGSTAVDVTDMEEAYEALNPAYGEDMQIGQGVNAYGQSYAYTKGLTEPENITGGWLIELNHQAWDEVNGFKTAKGVGFNVKSPEWAGDAAMRYVSEYYQAFENAVYATDAGGKYTGYNTETGKYFYEYVDMDSLVKVFLIQELGLNPDGFVSSLYFYKDADGLMYAGPIWDQDMTLGTGWTKYINSAIIDYHYLAEALIQIPAFEKRVQEYFKEEFAPMIRAALAADGTIDGYYDLLADNAELNYLLWPYIRVGDPANADHVWINTDYDDVVADMKTWMTQRLANMEERFAPRFEPGDANHDGKADSTDAVLIVRKLAGYDVPDFHEDTADFNGDGKADSTDAVLIVRKLAGY